MEKKRLQTVIFDMDGLLIDSEPWWEAAGSALLGRYGCTLTHDMYINTTGLRTREWLEYWFQFFGLPLTHPEAAEEQIVDAVVLEVEKSGRAMEGVAQIMEFFRQRGFGIGVATSSPLRLAEAVLKKLGIRAWVDACTSAEHLAYGKPHPEVYLQCAGQLNTRPEQTLCFEDSFNGLIAAKAAKMTCIAVPAPTQAKSPKWGAADLTIPSLAVFDEQLLKMLEDAG